MPRTVLLKHTLPDGTWHYDWLIARDGDEDGTGAGPTIAFRVDERIDAPGSHGEIVVDRLTDHRPLYLTYTGPVSDGRGSVERLAEGTCRVILEGSNLVEVEADFGWGPRVWTCTQVEIDDPARVVRPWRIAAA
ncbi:MAG: hypothetical protein IBJ10_03725 [Phycisphaerales bacterium]|nr:hypothetical protein [Phycisphaerales bacterium]